MHYPPILSREEGTSAVVTNVGTGRGGRRLARERGASPRTAKSCGPDAPGVASTPEEASASRGDGDKQIQVARESAYKSSSHCAGKAGVFPLNLYAHVRIFLSA